MLAPTRHAASRRAGIGEWGLGRRTTRFRRDLVLLTISLLIVGLLIFEEWQRQMDAFHLSIKEYAASLCTPEQSDGLVQQR
jgi:hypothetical protein